MLGSFHDERGLSAELARIDWHAPWLSDWRDLGEPLSTQLMHGAAFLDSLNCAARLAGAPIEFVSPQSVGPQAGSYDTLIDEQGTCPTRENLHDFFNALAWLKFPHTKACIHRLAAQEWRQSGPAASRGALRDALTVFDENGCVIWADLQDPAVQALAARDWQDAFVTQRPWWLFEPRVGLFGHALLEKLCAPRKPIATHAWVLPKPAMGDEDTQLAQALSAWAATEPLTKPFVAFPVLGVPGWDGRNANPDFYADASVFRPPRMPAQTHGSAVGLST